MNATFRKLAQGLALATLGACVSDLTVGYSAIEREDGGEQPDERVDGGSPSRDGGARDAQIVRDGCADGRCSDAAADAGPLDAGGHDAAARDGGASDADTSDASTADAGDGGKADAARDGGDASGDGGGAMCVPADCTPAGLTTTGECPNGRPPECRRNDEGLCDLLCEDPSGTFRKPT